MSVTATKPVPAHLVQTIHHSPGSLPCSPATVMLELTHVGAKSLDETPVFAKCLRSRGLVHQMDWAAPRR